MTHKCKNKLKKLKGSPLSPATQPRTDIQYVKQEAHSPNSRNFTYHAYLQFVTTVIWKPSKFAHC